MIKKKIKKIANSEILIRSRLIGIFYCLQMYVRIYLKSQVTRLYPSSQFRARVKSGKFGDTFANSVNPDDTAPYEPSHQDFHCLPSKFIFIPIFEIWNKQGRCSNLAVCPNIPDFTLLEKKNMSVVTFA